jgi:uncharacterized protein YutE (UPF0331/DUF86 family)
MAIKRVVSLRNLPVHWYRGVDIRRMFIELREGAWRL